MNRLGFFAPILVSISISLVACIALAKADDYSPFAQRTAGVFDLVYPTQAAADFGSPSTFLWYTGFATGPESWMQNDPTAKPQMDRVFREADAGHMIVQLGYEPNFAYQNKLFGLHLGTLVEALDVPNFDQAVLAISQALDRGVDPDTFLTARVRSFQAQGSGGWSTVSVDINHFLTAAIKWARYFRNKRVILRPMSEMNESSSGSWSFGARPENTPERFARAWILLQRLTKLSGAKTSWFVFSPLTYQPALVQAPPTVTALTSIMTTAPDSIDAMGLNVYSTGASPAAPYGFYDLVQPWLAIYRTIQIGNVFPLRGKPLVVPEMGINRAHFTSDAMRAAWLTGAYQAASEIGFVSVTYFHAGSGSSDFTVSPRVRSGAGAGEQDFSALKTGMATFQSGN